MLSYKLMLSYKYIVSVLVVLIEIGTKTSLPGAHDKTWSNSTTQLNVWRTGFKPLSLSFSLSLSLSLYIYIYIS